MTSEKDTKRNSAKPSGSLQVEETRERVDRRYESIEKPPATAGHSQPSPILRQHNRTFKTLREMRQQAKACAACRWPHEKRTNEANSARPPTRTRAKKPAKACTNATNPDWTPVTRLGFVGTTSQNARHHIDKKALLDRDHEKMHRPGISVLSRREGMLQIMERQKRSSGP